MDKAPHRAIRREVIRQRLELSAEDFDKQFLVWLEAQTKTSVNGFKEWQKRLSGLAGRVKEGRPDENFSRLIPLSSVPR